MFADHRDAELTGTGQPEPETDFEPEGDETVRVEREPEAESEVEEELEADGDRPEPAEPESGPGEPSRHRRAALVVGGVTLVIALLAGLCTLPSVRTILRQSFTKLPTPYTEMYFSGTPTVSGITLSVPVTVVNHATTQDSFSLKAWTTNAAGKTDSTTSFKVTPKHGQATVVVNVAVQMPVDAQVLWINLAGQPQTLHYRIAGQAVPSSTATPSGTPSPSATSTAKH